MYSFCGLFLLPKERKNVGARVNLIRIWSVSIQKVVQHKHIRR